MSNSVSKSSKNQELPILNELKNKMQQQEQLINQIIDRQQDGKDSLSKQTYSMEDLRLDNRQIRMVQRYRNHLRDHPTSKPYMQNPLSTITTPAISARMSETDFEAVAIMSDRYNNNAASYGGSKAQTIIDNSPRYVDNMATPLEMQGVKLGQFIHQTLPLRNN